MMLDDGGITGMLKEAYGLGHIPSMDQALSQEDLDQHPIGLLAEKGSQVGFRFGKGSHIKQCLGQAEPG